MFSMVIGIMSCGEDEENISQKPTPNPGLIKPTTQVAADEPGDAWQIVWVRVDPVTGQETYISEHIYIYDILKQQDILAVKVLDKEGNPVPNARVEWTLLDSPHMVGDIIETDDPGFQKAAPQIKVDNKFAFTFTNAEGDRTREMEFKCPAEVSHVEGSDYSMKKPTSINVGKEGETWIVITAARRGLTDIAAYCPDIVAEAPSHKIFATKVWDCYDWEFPNTEIPNDCETIEHTFTTRIFNHLTGNPQPGIDVRYTILNPKLDTIIAGNGTQTVVTSDLNGEVAVTIEAPTTYPRVDPMKVLVEILFRDDMDICDGREFVIGCATVTKWWEVETLRVTVSGELISCLENADNLTGTFSVTNLGPPDAEDVIADNVTLTVDYPQEEEITVVDTDGGTNDGDKITWNIGTLPSGDTASRNPIFAASSGGVYTFTATTESKCTAAGPVTWTVKIIAITATCSLDSSVIVLDPGEVFDEVLPCVDPEARQCGQYITTYTLIVENVGGDAVNMTLGLDPLPDGLKLISGEPEDIKLNPGETFEKPFELKATLRATGEIESEYTVAVKGRVDNIKSANSNVVCLPQEPTLVWLAPDPCEIMIVAGPAMLVRKTDTKDPIKVHDLTRYRMLVWNQGTADAYDVTIVDTLPAQISLVTDVVDLVDEDDQVVCLVELVDIERNTGDVEDILHVFEPWDFDKGDLPININGIPGVLDGNTTLTIDVTGSVITFTFDKIMKPTWAFRISFYAQANAVGTVVNRTGLTYREEPVPSPVLPTDGPVNSDESTTIR